MAPEICSPWSEGRKVFVRDLIEFLRTSHQITVLTTVPAGESTNFPVPHEIHKCRWKPGLLIRIIKELPSMIADYQPDVVCHFPYATFRHYYGFVNKPYMVKIDRICREKEVPCISIMYSIDAYVTPQELELKVSCLAMGTRDNWQGNTIDPGLRFSHWPAIKPKENEIPTILFMAGMWQTSKRRVDFVLDTRGLGILLQAGEYLKGTRVKLIIAAPLFSDKLCRNYLLNSSLNTWCIDDISLESTVKIPDIYTRADLFVFPYTKNDQHFIPTSVVEAMSSGTPVLISDLPLFNGLVREGETGSVFETGNPVSLANTIRNALSDREKLSDMGEAAMHYAHKRWSIENSARQLIELAENVTGLT